jgi:chemotaxis family two-component system response regulator Rcp1
MGAGRFFGGDQANVLLVEDNIADQRLITEAFRDSNPGAKIHVVSDGVEALTYLKREARFTDAPRPDLIILDLNLPRKDGRELLAEIKVNAEFRRIPVIVFTTSNAATDITQTYALHANCYINKPIHLDNFLHVIDAINHFWLKTVELPSQAAV